MRLICLLAAHALARPSPSTPLVADTPCTGDQWPRVCPGTLPPADTQSWLMNRSTIIMPCNYTGFMDPRTVAKWSIKDWDWSNFKGRGTADGWAKHKPMDDEELLFKQIQMTAADAPGSISWAYKNTVYGYPWVTQVRVALEDPAYAPWFVKFKPVGPWYSQKCDSANKSLCSDFYHSQEQSPGFPHGDGDCAGPACDCGSLPCGFYVFNHSSTVKVNGQSFQEWFVDSYMFNFVGSSPLVSGFFWDDVCSCIFPPPPCMRRKGDTLTPSATFHQPPTPNRGRGLQHPRPGPAHMRRHGPHRRGPGAAHRRLSSEHGGAAR